MAWLNYHHFYYFYVVAREGGFAAAARKLHLAHPTLSKQVRQLEDMLGKRLFERRGRSLELTAAGHRAYGYAHEIFTMGDEFFRAEAKGESTRPRTVVGVTAALPKLITRELLLPAYEAVSDLHLIVVEDDHDRLLTRLALHELDLVLADAPVPPNSSIRAFNHILGSSGLSFLAAPELCAELSERAEFPQSLHEAPMLLPARGTAIRRVFEPWLDRHGLAPRIVAEMDDLALIKAFGQSGRGVFFAPTIVEADVMATFSVELLGRTDELREQFIAITMQRRLVNPVVVAVCDSAKRQLSRL
ncbi:MAG: LysR family transcriptional regulator [Myxococcales bacterium]|nr:LysR family transcriptional regulator [Myxococcales bacterium]